MLQDLPRNVSTENLLTLLSHKLLLEADLLCQPAELFPQIKDQLLLTTLSPLKMRYRIITSKSTLKKVKMSMTQMKMMDPIGELLYILLSMAMLIRMKYMIMKQIVKNVMTLTIMPTQLKELALGSLKQEISQPGYPLNLSLSQDLKEYFHHLTRIQLSLLRLCQISLKLLNQDHFHLCQLLHQF